MADEKKRLEEIAGELVKIAVEVDEIGKKTTTEGQQDKPVLVGIASQLVSMSGTVHFESAKLPDSSEDSKH